MINAQPLAQQLLIPEPFRTPQLILSGRLLPPWPGPRKPSSKNQELRNRGQIQLWGEDVQPLLERAGAVPVPHRGHIPSRASPPPPDPHPASPSAVLIPTPRFRRDLAQNGQETGI